MEDAKRWSVTYTKHVKQKRKVYQDGFLELHSSSHKVILYDDCEKILDTKFMKIERDVKSGETLVFDCYLVDIGDLHGEHKSKVNENSEVRDKNIDKKPRFLHSRTVRDCTEDKKPNIGVKKTLSNSLSPSQKIIREFKKGEVRKYSSSPSSLVMTKSCEDEWQVLYTTYLTQKAKKFHDGFLRVLASGSQCKQWRLENMKETKSLDSKFQGSSNGNGGKIGLMNGQVHSHHNSAKGAEWDVMYTSQVTQKSKKYNSGVLRLSSSGSFQSQVTLLTEDGNILARRFLKLSENVKTGITLNFPNYLVEVGEICTIQGEPLNCASPSNDTVSITKGFSINNSKFSSTVSANRPLVEMENGDHERNQEPLLDSKFQGSRNGNGGKTGLMNGQVHSHHNSAKGAEWDVMYTSHVTQKSKKYNSGVLRLSSSVSFQSQVTLLTDEGNMLARRFLKLSEHVETGITLNFPNYLVEVGEIRTTQGEPLNCASPSKDTVSITKGFSINNSKFSSTVSANKPLHEREAQTKAFLADQVSLNTRSSSLNNSGLSPGVAKKPVRAAHEILSFLKKPNISEHVSRESAFTVQMETMQSSGCAPLDVKFMQKNNLHPTEFKEGSIERIDEETITTDTKSSKHISVESALLESLSGTPIKIAPESLPFRENPTRETGKEEKEASECLEMKKEEKPSKFAKDNLKSCQVESVCSAISQPNNIQSSGLCDTEDGFDSDTWPRTEGQFPSFDLGF